MIESVSNDTDALSTNQQSNLEGQNISVQAEDFVEKGEESIEQVEEIIQENTNNQITESIVSDGPQIEESFSFAFSDDTEENPSTEEEFVTEIETDTTPIDFSDLFNDEEEEPVAVDEKFNEGIIESTVETAVEEIATTETTEILETIENTEEAIEPTVETVAEETATTETTEILETIENAEEAIESTVETVVEEIATTETTEILETIENAEEAIEPTVETVAEEIATTETTEILETIEQEPEIIEVHDWFEKQEKEISHDADLISQYIAKNPNDKKICISEDTEKNQVNLAESSVSESECATETMAKIFEKQGFFKEAIKIYEKLNLKYPEKSVYFANRISELKNKKSK